MYEMRWHEGVGQYRRGTLEARENVARVLATLCEVRREAAVYRDGHQVGAATPYQGQWSWWLEPPLLQTAA